MLTIKNVPDKILRQKSKPIEKVDKKIIQFTNQLIETLLHKSDPPGVGLSGIQVGKPWSIFITHLPKDKSLSLDKWAPKNQQITVFINPQVIQVSIKKTLGGKKDKPMLEGCLSIPGIYGPVWRHEWIKAKYQTLPITVSPDGGHYVDSSGVNDPIEVTKKFKGFNARVVQHEYDHLEGILFTDYTIKDSQPIYIEDGDHLSEISNPEDLIKW